ncbi:hypothetical protein BUALT_Bualt12G0055800 [Buddleja alternifolia]|uniref:F-box domain-containing protein n=1 Tax=Buddleja alternifolia TaxID=168488 RepID=A0AAV6WZK8_9LAMI|nr:hypothetical protein BUALT_Bualt12G0055700 [Buddleja alternifolia]KAG8372339.1 hypothetical protein BUALT_Bualt12G0055800 [Buddleja alternifolia]
MNCKRSSSSSAAAIIGGNDDLLLEILQFLPTKSLIRFQLVSKQFQYLISDSSFRQLHTLRLRHRPKPQPSFILRSATSQFFYCHPTVKKLTPFRFQHANMKIVQSCNGLLLLEDKDSGNTPKDHYIYNPVTMQSRKLVIGDEEMKYFAGVSLVFDPSKSPHYKVVCLRKGRYFGLNEYMVVKVYDSETHTWKHYGKDHITDKQFWNDIYLDNEIYFIKPSLKTFCLYVRDDDMWENLRRSYSFTCSVGVDKHHIIESNGSIYGVDVLFRESGNSFSVLGLLNDGCWYIMCNATYNHCGSAFCILGTIIRGKKEGDSILLFHVPGKIMVYRFYEEVFEVLDKEVFEVLVDFTSENYYEEGKLQFNFKDAHQFIETLAPV